MEGFRYGAVLKVQRDHTREAIFSAMDKIRELGMNTIVVWPAVYWWEDRDSADYPYGTGHAILRYAEKIGLKVVMELAGQLPCLEYAPDWKVKDEYFPVCKNGERNYTGNLYGYYNYNHPEVKELIRQHYRRIAENYKGYSSLYAYDIWNETDFTSYDDHTLQLFQEWLKEKYGTIGRLNDVWDRTYPDWSRIDFAQWLWASVMPKVDYEEFHKDNIGIILRYMKNAIREVDREHPVIADNILNMVTLPMTYDRGQDDWVVAKNTDIFGMDMYPKYGKYSFPDFLRNQTFVCASSATRNGAFWVSELQTHFTSIFDSQSYVYPHEIRFWAWEAISHGAKGLIYWKWEQFNKGLQTFGRGLVDRKGNYTARALEAGKIAKILDRYDSAFSTFLPEKPKAAILFDRLSYDFVETLKVSFGDVMGVGKPDSFYTDSMMGIYKSLWDQNIASVFITDDDIKENRTDGYNVIFVSNHINISPDLAEGLKRFMAEGGLIVADGKFGEISDEGIVYRQIPGAGLHKALGFEILDMQPFDLGIRLTISSGATETIRGYHERRELLLEDNVVILGEFEDGMPAIIRADYGKGALLYASTMLWLDYLKDLQASATIRALISEISAEKALRSFESNHDRIKISVLRSGDGALVFAFNYTAADQAAEFCLPVVRDGRYEIEELYSEASESRNSSDLELRFPIRVTAENVAVYYISPSNGGE